MEECGKLVMAGREDLRGERPCQTLRIITEMEAQREAFWRAHARGRSPTDRAEVDQVTALRKADYWSSQMRGRVLCQASGGCL